MRAKADEIISKMIKTSINSISKCTVAVIVNVDQLSQGFVSVQPLINISGFDGESLEAPVISYVPVILPSTTSCGIVFPIKQGDTCLLIFPDRNIDEFKFGNKQPHDVVNMRRNSMADAVAIIGFNTTQDNSWSDRNHSEEHDIDSVKVYNNKGTGSENFIELKSDGSVKVKSPSQVDVEAPVVNAKLVNVDDVIINGVGSVKAFVLGHTHNYTDDGNPMVTAPPNPVG